MPSTSNLVDLTKRADDERTIRVLVADDDPDVRDGVTTYLSSAGFDVIAAVEDGVEAFEQAVWQRPDVVVMDLHMPGVDGIASTDLIHTQMPRMPVVILTAFADPESRWAARLAGATVLVAKDEPLSALEQTLRSVTNS
jgi:DNA-binding NarL/FixJ family response regulator